MPERWDVFTVSPESWRKMKVMIGVNLLRAGFGSGVRYVLPALLGGLCLGLGLVIAGEVVVPVAEVAALPAGEATAVPEEEAAAEPDTAALSAEILERPLFTPGRHPPVVAAPVAAAPEEKPKAPELKGRLAGVMLSREGREALFARPGERPVGVTEGGQIDGWTVASIEEDRVVLKSAFGEKVLEPMPGERGEGVAPARALRRPPPPRAPAAVAGNVPPPGTYVPPALRPAPPGAYVPPAAPNAARPGAAPVRAAPAAVQTSQALVRVPRQ